MALIQDIRLFESDVPNADGHSLPNYIGRLYHYAPLTCAGMIQRLLFLLRHRGFSFDGFDHLYLNFTPCLPHGELRDVNRYAVREFSWYRYVDVGCDIALFHSWTLHEQTAFILEAVKNASVMKASEALGTLFSDTFDEVLQKGEQLILPYKQKENGNLIVDLLLRIKDEPCFLPIIRVTDKAGTVKSEQQLPAYCRDAFISQIGSITVEKSYVRITPRKNLYTKHFGLKPIRIDW